MTYYEETFGHWIALIYRGSQNYFAKKLDKYKISRGQHNFLLVLLKKDGISQDDLVKILLLNKAAVARALVKLEKNGFVKRKKDEIDRRTNLVYLTEKAKKLEPVLMKMVEASTNTLSRNMTRDEKQTVINSLKKMSKNFIEEIEKDDI